MNRMFYVFGLLVLGTLILCCSCTKEEKTVAGVAIGAGSGAIIGGAAGGGTGAAIGAGVGGLTGGLIGHSLGDDDDEK